MRIRIRNLFDPRSGMEKIGSNNATLDQTKVTVFARTVVLTLSLLDIPL
jgi:hypothetical protein